MRRIIRKVTRFIVGFLILAVGGYTLLYVFINERGKEIFLDQLKKRFNIEVNLESLNFSFPLRFSLVGFQFKEINFSQAIIDIGAINPFTNRVTINSLYMKNLLFKLDRESISFMQSKIANGGIREIDIKDTHIKGENVNRKIGNSSTKREDIPLEIVVKNIILDNASLTFRDSTLKPPLNVRLGGIKAKINDFKYPTLGKFSLDLESSLAINEKKMKDAVSAYGWIDWQNKDMDVFFKLKEIDYFVFDPYYPSFWKPKNLDLKEAILSLDSHLVSKNDNLLIDYYIILNKVIFIEESEDPSKVKTLKTILAIFEKDGKSRVHLRFRTKMSSPRFKITSIGEGLLLQLKKMDTTALADTLDQFFDKTQAAVENGVKSLKGLTIDPTLGAVKGFLDEFLKNLKKIIGREEETDTDNQ
jgi:hypothetical protein